MYKNVLPLTKGIIIARVGYFSPDSSAVIKLKGCRSDIISSIISHSIGNIIVGPSFKDIITYVIGSFNVTSLSSIRRQLFQRVDISCLSFKRGKFSCFDFCSKLR